MIQNFLLWLLNKRVGWGEKVVKPFDKWIYNHIK